MKSLKTRRNNKIKWSVFALTLLVMVVLPVFAFSSRKSDLYVDDDASGYQNGSKKHPYETINQAISKADKNTEIHVANGVYKESVTLKKKIKLQGEDKEKTIIKSKKDKWSVVTFDDEAEINNFTLKEGKRGIYIQSRAKAKITNCIIRDNDEDGIIFEGGDMKKSTEIVISNNDIKRNDASGIYGSGKRRVTITDNDIYKNNFNGINLSAGTVGWIGNNKIDENKLNGIKMVIDGASIFTKGNEVRQSGNNGFEISSFGGGGQINIEKTKIVLNGDYAIAKLAKSVAAQNNSYWNKNLTFQGLSNDIWGNSSGNISGIISVR